MAKKKAVKKVLRKQLRKLSKKQLKTVKKHPCQPICQKARQTQTSAWFDETHQIKIFFENCADGDQKAESP